MFVDLLVTVIGSTIIGWNVGSWLLPASWLAVLYLAAIIMKVRPPLALRQRGGNRRPAHRISEQ
jgi:hypothetical protein